MENIQKLKNQISVLRALLREKEEKLRIAEAIEKEKDELWRKEHAPPTKNSDPATKPAKNANPSEYTHPPTITAKKSKHELTEAVDMD